MTRVPATEVKNNLRALSDIAMSDPVIITSNQIDWLVLLSTDEYLRLTKGSDLTGDRDKDRIKRS